jgi:hypothetical protein
MNEDIQDKEARLNLLKEEYNLISQKKGNLIDHEIILKE